MTLANRQVSRKNIEKSMEYSNSSCQTCDDRLTLAIEAHMEVIAQTNEHLATLAQCASETITLVKKVFKVYVPWIVALIAVAYPTAGKIISSLPSIG